MRTVDETKARRIVEAKRKGRPIREIAAEAGVTVRWVQILCKRFEHCEEIRYPDGRGRRRNGMPGRREHSAVLCAFGFVPAGAVRLAGNIEAATGIRTNHNVIHGVMRQLGLARPKRPRKKRSWVRYEHEHSNSMWHADYMLMDDGRWLIVYQDDASRFIVGWGVFDRATAENALAVLEEAVRKHGKPESVLTDHGSQFYANTSARRKTGPSKFGLRLAELGIKHVLARVGHPQTNGKVERFFLEVRRYLRVFESASYAGKTRGGGTHVGGPLNAEPPRDPMDRFVRWYNYARPHMSLDRGTRETPARAFRRKMPPGS